MKIPKQLFLAMAGVLFVLVVAATSLTIFGIGNAYKKGIANFVNQKEPEKLTLFKKKTVKKITIKNSAERGCIEVTPDGAVRVYSVCGQTLTGAERLADPKHILKLFKLVTEEDLGAYTQKSAGTLYQVAIETDSGTQTVYLVLSESGGVAQTIIRTIQTIINDLPKPTPIVGLSPTSVPTPIGGSLTRAPTGTSFLPTATPTIAPSSEVQTFTCGFSESGDKKKPYNISNIVCSTEPTPIP